MGRGGYALVKEKMVRKREVMQRRSGKWSDIEEVVDPSRSKQAADERNFETVKSVGAKRTTRSIRKDSSSQDS
ncbi:hypothetical protein Tco_1123055 [Tanacetum coccineum]|uniref:Uncharacterized protein n=1 Tax=Tanacetum coccineum TaxID=301880 RepID=A0ABQ5J3N9_9ASTR